MTSKFALVIANTEYQDASFAKLTAPGKDAEEFANVLREPELAAFDDVQVLLNEGEGKTRRSIARFFAERKSGDLLLLYFSGHGIRNEQGQLFLAANDTEISILDATGIPADFITYAMNNSRSQRQLLILDCCNSGAFAHGSKSASAVGKSMGIASAFEGSGFGRVVLTATDATQYAWEGDKIIGDTQKSVFTHFLIEGLRGEADRDGDGRIHVDELYDYAYEQVVRRTPKQTPGKWSYKQQGDIVLRENLKPRDVKPVPLPSDLFYYLEHPSSGVRSTGVQELIRLLDGKHLGLARAAQEKLHEIAENDDSLSLRKIASDTLMAHGLGLEQSRPLSIENPIKDQEIEKKITRTNATQRREPVSTEALVSSSRTAIAGKLSEMKNFVPSVNLRFVAGVIGVLLVISLFFWSGSKLLINPPLTPQTTNSSSSNPTEVRTSQSLGTPVSQSQLLSANTPLPTRTAIPLPPTSIPTSSILGVGSTKISEKDDMTLVYVPEGEFTMGSESGTYYEKPVHSVSLDAFWIDKTEVTNKMYALCVSAGVCFKPTNTISSTHTSYYGNSKFDDFPVIYVDWNMAKTYCEWAERRLPTEAEWEKAARGTDKRKYPWGNNNPDGGLLNYKQGDATIVGNYPDGASPYGALDMAGNVQEWVADWFSETYYEDLAVSNPLGPESGSSRAVRGGTWYLYGPTGYGVFYRVGGGGFTTWNRRSNAPDFTYYNLGFRCALNATP